MRNILIVLGLLVCQACTDGTTDTAEPLQSATIVEVGGVKPAGSGFADVEGKLINYDYKEFSGFYLQWKDAHTIWRGHDGGYWEGVIALRAAQVSKVADGIYFTSWPGPFGGGDNVVHDLNNMKVYAHLAGTKYNVKLINGDIQCFDQPDCVAPGDNYTDPQVMLGIIADNIKQYDLPDRARLEDLSRPLIPQHQAARDDLRGKAIVFRTQGGETRIEVDGNETRVSENGNPAKPEQTYATRIDEHVYFLTWAGPDGGNHMLFNTETMKVFDHRLPDLTRGEQIYTITCFADVGEC